LDCHNNNLNSTELNKIFTALSTRAPADGAKIYIRINPGAPSNIPPGSADISIATAKNWTVD